MSTGAQTSSPLRKGFSLAVYVNVSWFKSGSLPATYLIYRALAGALCTEGTIHLQALKPCPLEWWSQLSQEPILDPPRKIVWMLDYVINLLPHFLAVTTDKLTNKITISSIVSKNCWQLIIPSYSLFSTCWQSNLCFIIPNTNYWISSIYYVYQIMLNKP